MKIKLILSTMVSSFFLFGCGVDSMSAAKVATEIKKQELRTINHNLVV